MEELDTGSTPDQSQSVSDRTSSFAYQKGKEHLAAGYLGLALEKFKAALSQDPSSTAVLNALAVTYGRLGRHDLAELYYDRALAIDPTFSVALNNVGYSMVTRGRNEEALIYFEQALKHEELESSRRLILANRQKAMDNLRLAREKKSVAVMEKASLPVEAAAAPSEDGCALSSGRAIDRSSARVYSLNTSGSARVSASDRPTIDCNKPVRARVAIVSTQSGGGATATVSTARALASAEPAATSEAMAASKAPAAKEPVVAEAVAPNPSDEKTASADASKQIDATETVVAVSEAAVTPDLKVEISNGAGRNKLAARLRTYLESKGMPVSFLTNAARFDYSQTTIFYKSGARAAAEKFAAQLPVTVKFVESGAYYADVRIRLGADILTFDKSVLYAAAYGEINA
jgi:tetratricopeptide (TPR) repeat protein